MTQLKYQDPLDPASSEDFAAQLAQFSSLEQLININSSLQESQNSNILLTQSISNSLTAALIGKGVKVDGNTINHLSGEAEKIEFELDDKAVNVTVEIKDINGFLVKRIVGNNLKQGTNNIIWDGKNQDGTQSDSGEYTVNIIAKNESNGEVGVINYMNGRIEGVRFDGGEALLLVNGKEYDIGRVREVFEIQ